MKVDGYVQFDDRSSHKWHLKHCTTPVLVMFNIIFKWNVPMASNSDIVHSVLCSPNVSIWIFFHMMNNAKKKNGAETK